MQKKLIQWKDSNDETKDLSLLEYGNFLYSKFGHPAKQEVKIKKKPDLKKLKAYISEFEIKHPKTTMTKIEREQRSGLVVEYVKARANGVCQLCGKPAPFYNKAGEPYLECHHIVWLAKVGDDNVDNAVALCPNCHRKMHIINEPVDVEKLKVAASKN